MMLEAIVSFRGKHGQAGWFKAASLWRLCAIGNVMKEGWAIHLTGKSQWLM